MKTVICQSGHTGWEDKLHSVYTTYEEFCSYDSSYNIAERLGFSDTETAWEENPTIQGSIKPSDLRKVS